MTLLAVLQTSKLSEIWAIRESKLSQVVVHLVCVYRLRTLPSRIFKPAPQRVLGSVVTLLRSSRPIISCFDLDASVHALNPVVTIQCVDAPVIPCSTCAV